MSCNYGIDRPRTSSLIARTNNAAVVHAQTNKPRLMASRLEVRVEVRDCAKFVKVVKVDDRKAERIMRTEIQDRFVIKSPPTDVPVIS